MDNSNLKNNIDHYMKLKGIKEYTRLLVAIAHELGIKGEAAYEFANREKGNFSKMLRGERKLKYDFIVPLEKIFGVSLARLLCEDAYKLPVEKENVPFDKGLRYYAYVDDPQLYKEEFDVLQTQNGESILAQTDEFGKTFLDYVVEYHAVNGVRYLHDTYGIRVKWGFDTVHFRNDKGIAWIHYEKCIEFARLVASMNDVELFNDIYDSYNMFFSNGHYANAPFSKSDYFEVILDYDGLFESIFQEKMYEVRLGSCDRRKQVDSVTMRLINPIINNCLRHALEHLDTYEHRAIAILKFGIDHNRKIVGKGSYTDFYICNELGGVKSLRDEDFYDIVIFADVDVDTDANDEIKSLLNQLPKFRKSYI